MASLTDTFEGEKGFCWNCGSILPMLGDSGSVKCFMCKFEYGPEAFGAMENHYEIFFHSPYDYITQEHGSQTMQKPSLDKNDGPIVERKCAKCGNDTMSYATLQLRSADEGQTVFYTCTKCRADVGLDGSSKRIKLSTYLKPLVKVCRNDTRDKLPNDISTSEITFSEDI